MAQTMRDKKALGLLFHSDLSCVLTLALHGRIISVAPVGAGRYICSSPYYLISFGDFLDTTLITYLFLFGYFILIYNLFVFNLLSIPYTTGKVL